jgi:hypothetical protein
MFWHDICIYTTETIKYCRHENKYTSSGKVVVPNQFNGTRRWKKETNFGESAINGVCLRQE